MRERGALRSKALKRVLEALATAPQLDSARIRALTRLPERTARHALTRLMRLGLVEAVPDFSDLRAKKFRLREGFK